MELGKNSSLDGTWLQAVPGAVDTAAVQVCICLGSTWLVEGWSSLKPICYQEMEGSCSENGLVVEQQRCLCRISKFAPKKICLKIFLSAPHPCLSSDRHGGFGSGHSTPPDTDNPPVPHDSNRAAKTYNLAVGSYQLQIAQGSAWPGALRVVFFPAVVYQPRAAR